MNNLAEKYEPSDFYEEDVVEKKKARVYHLHDLLPQPTSPEEITAEVERIAELRESYMDEKNLNSPINMIKKALSRGERNSAEIIRENKVADIEAELLFIKEGIDDKIDLEKKKMASVLEYYNEII